MLTVHCTNFELSHLTFRKCCFSFCLASPSKDYYMKYILYLGYLFICHTFIFPLFSSCLSGGLLQQQLSLRSPESVSQVRSSEECPAVCLTSVKLRKEHVFFFYLLYLVWTFPCHHFSLFSLFSPPCLPPSSSAHELAYVTTFTFFAICPQLQRCSLDCFVIKLIIRVQTQVNLYFRQALTHSVVY